MDIWTKDKRSSVMSKIRSKNTKPEIILRKALFSNGFRYRIHDKNFPGKPDIVMPKYRTVIFVHGCFWHHHSDCKEGKVPKTNTKFWSEKLSKNIERDVRHNLALTALGWKIITVWECEIEKRLSVVLDKLITEIKF
jgi:DNA mismatch endonuclease (patch repair protein)